LYVKRERCVTSLRRGKGGPITSAIRNDHASKKRSFFGHILRKQGVERGVPALKGLHEESFSTWRSGEGVVIFREGKNIL